jgi:cyclically-permuted mutarotase family protein
MIRNFLLLTIFFSMTSTAQVKKKSEVLIKWKVAAVVPPSGAQLKSPGFAGPINGVNNNVFIVAGGANFPNGLPWEGGKKYYSNEIHVLQKEGSNFIWNKNVRDTLPEPIAYCGVTSTEKGIVFAGGENEDGISDKAYLLKWNPGKTEISVISLPAMPLALTNLSLTHINNTVFAAGGDEKNNSSKKFFCLDLENENAQWKSLPDLPIALANATLIAQNNGLKKNIYLIGGRTKTVSGISELHPTTFVFDLKKNEWEKCADISDGKNITNLSAAAAIAVDKNNILIIGGDNGIVFHKIETYISQIAKAGSEEKKEKLTKEKNALSIDHKGFYKGLLMYNTLKNKWTKIGEYPYPAQVTTTAVKWGNDIVVSNGEIKPGIRTPDVIIGTIQ